MAFLKKVTNSSGYTYLSCVEGYRENGKLKQRVVKNFGRLDVLKSTDPDPIKTAEEFVEAYNKEVETGTILIKQSLYRKRDEFAFKLYGGNLLEGIYKKQGIQKFLKDYMAQKKFEFDLNKVFKLLCYKYTLQGSLGTSAVKFQRELFGNWNVSENHINRSLKHLSELSDQMQLTMNKNTNRIGLNMAYIEFFDITVYFPESNVDRKEYPMTIMILLYDEMRIPIAHKICNIKGPEIAYLSDEIAQLKSKYKINELVQIQVRPLTLESFDILKSHPYSYLVYNKAHSIDNLPKNISDFVLSPNDWEYDKKCRSAKKSIILPLQTSQGTSMQKVVAYWNEVEANQRMKIKAGTLEFSHGLRKPTLYTKTKNGEKKQYSKITLKNVLTNESISMHPYLDWESSRINEVLDLNGITIICTSQTKESDQNLIKVINNCANTWKSIDNILSEKHESNLSSWSLERINVLFLTWFVTLRMLKLLEVRLLEKIDIDTIQTALKSGRAKLIHQGYYVTQANNNLVRILKRLRLDFSNELQPSENIERIKRLY